MDQATVSPPASTEISFRELLSDIWRAKTVVAVVTVVFTVGGIVIGLTSDRLYEASMVLSPVAPETNTGRGGLGALASQYSGLAALAGISIGGLGSKKDESLAVLQSELLTEEYIRQQNLLPVLYAQQWDAASHSWKSADPKKIPTVWKANRYFKNNVRQVTDDKKTGLVLLSIKWKDPRLAAQWANDLVTMTNRYLREKAIREAEANIAYLNEQARQSNVVEAQKAIYSLLEQEINKEMLAKGREEYALKVIDPAFVPEKPSSPGPMLLGLLGLVLGFMGSVMVLFGRRALFL
jgi:uncharacterized protein involved in exopolysaccharide biosynthesis